MARSQREWDEINLQAKSNADAALERWQAEFLGHRVGGTLAAPAPMPAQPEQGTPDTVAPTPGGSDMGGAQSSMPLPGAGGGNAPGGY